MLMELHHFKTQTRVCQIHSQNLIEGQMMFSIKNMIFIPKAFMKSTNLTGYTSSCDFTGDDSGNFSICNFTVIVATGSGSHREHILDTIKAKGRERCHRLLLIIMAMVFF